MQLSKVLLIALIIVLSVLRMVLVSEVDTPNYDAFYGIRQVSSIGETGFPLIVDDLSYQGRVSFGNSLAYYLMSIFSLLLPTTFAFQYFSSVLFGVVLFLTYLISRQLFLGRYLSVLVTFLVGTSSLIFLSHLNTLVPSAFFMVFLLLGIYSFFANKPVLFLVSTVSMTITSSLSLGVLLGFLFYLLILNLEQLKLKKQEFELLFFSIIFGLWYNLVIYKKLLFQFGSQAVWGGIPTDVQIQLFQSLDAPVLTAVVGSIPLLLGAYGAYSSLFEQKNRKLLLIVSIALSFGILTWLALLPLSIGLLYISLSLLLLSGYGALKIKSFFSKTIVGWVQPLLISVLVVLTLVGFVGIFSDNPLPSLSPSSDELLTLEYIRENTANDVTVLGSIADGHVITEVAQRKNVIDDQFILAPQAQQRYEDVRTIYLSQSQINVLHLLQTYSVDYIYVSNQVKTTYPATSYIFETSDCFSPFFETATTTVYSIKCININAD